MSLHIENSENKSMGCERLFEVDDLGAFSMETIRQALVIWTGVDAVQERGTCGLRTERRHGQASYPEDSDCSWTHEDDSGTFYVDMRRQLSAFALDFNQTNLTIPLLSRHKRRFVHATAQVLGLGHASLGACSKYRRMIVFKDTPAFPDDGVQRQLEQHQPSGQDSMTRKRKRLDRIDRGFPCQFDGCHRIFDRACERSKHEQTHQPEYTKRFQCPHCSKCFRYPKDLRRHEKVHGDTANLPNSSRAATLVEPQPLRSAFTEESRVSSETSLTFSSNTASNDCSPFLAPSYAEHALGIEPYVLDETAWVQSDAVQGQEWNYIQDFVGLGFDDIDGSDEGLLEMARTKK